MRFTEEITIEKELQAYLNEVLSLSLIPSDPESTNKGVLEEWNVTKIGPQEITVSLNFSNPELVSPRSVSI